MRIGIHSASASVKRALESMILAAGHLLAATPESAELVLYDAQHPGTQPLPSCPNLTLLPRTGVASEHELACPLRPAMLIQRLVMLTHTQALTLGHGWSLDGLARSLQHPAHPAVTLTEKECSLLRALAGSADTAIRREELLEQVWGVGSSVDTHTLETHIYRLRAKLGEMTPPPCDLLTENGAYRLVLAG